MRTESDVIRSVQRWLAGILPAPWDIRTTLEPNTDPVRPYATVEPIDDAAATGPPVRQDVTLPVTLNLYLDRQATAATADDKALGLREQLYQAVKWGPDLRRPTTDRIPLYDYTPRPQRTRLNARAATAPFKVTVGGEQTALIATDASQDAMLAAVEALASIDTGDAIVQRRSVGVWDLDLAGQYAGQTVTVTATAPVVVTTMLTGRPAPWRTNRDWVHVTDFSQHTARDPADPRLVSVHVDLRLTFTRSLPIPFAQKLLQRVVAQPEAP